MKKSDLVVEGGFMKRGAEAEIFRVRWLGLDAVRKVRVPREYRVLELDRTLRRERTRKEAYLIKLAGNAGVTTPVIYDIDLGECSITMEYMGNRRAKEELNSNASSAEKLEICRSIGREVATLHNAGICHGDLTTSNILIRDGKIGFIDLSLGTNDSEIEDLAVDLHGFRETFDSTHIDLDGGWGSVLRGYAERTAEGNDIMDALDRVEDRGRYR